MAMRKKIKFFISFLLIGSSFLFFTGCDFAGKPDGGIYKSIDGGKTFEQRTYISEKANISNVNILSMEVDPSNSQTIYIGTLSSGLYRSVDGGEHWARDLNDFKNITDITVHPTISQIIYISTKKDGRGKIIKTENGGENWKEVYTLNNDGPIVASMAMDKKNPSTLYIGTSNGGIFKTEDGGNTWRSLFWAGSSIRKIAFDIINSSIAYFGTVSDGLLVTKDGGSNFIEVKKSGYIYNILPHPTTEGSVFLSDKNGLQRSIDFGENWEVINTLVKPEELGSRGLDVNPKNPREIYYASAKAFYKSTDDGASWSPVQFNTTRSIETIEIDPNNSSIIYLGMYKRTGTSGFKLFP